jgi:hypothetical protein
MQEMETSSTFILLELQADYVPSNLEMLEHSSRIIPSLKLIIEYDRCKFVWTDPNNYNCSCSAYIKWQGIDLSFNISIQKGQRSQSIAISIVYQNIPYRFGIGISSVGAGSIGKSPVVVANGKQLTFKYGFNYLYIEEELTEKR